MAPLDSQETTHLLGEAVTYLREIASYNRRADLLATLSNEEHRAAYAVSDGSRTADEVKEAAGINSSPRTVVNWWKKWVEAGIAERMGDGKVKGRYDLAVLPPSAAEGE